MSLLLLHVGGPTSGAAPANGIYWGNDYYGNDMFGDDYFF